jgi:Ca2+-binding RTX toxin-like protein
MDVNDTIAQAFETNLSSNDPGTFNNFGFIGDNSEVPDGEDVDIYKVQLNVGDKLSVDIDAEAFGLNSVLRVFNAAGNQVDFSDDTFPNDTFSTDSLIDFTASTSGVYYIGVSSNDNTDYDPEVEGSGSNSNSSSFGTTGDYNLEITVDPVRNFTGTSADEVFVGGNANNSISGFGGDDDLIGQGGNDTIKGGSGDDLISAGSGDDSVEGGTGDDDLTAGSGNDIVKGGDGIDFINGGADSDVLQGGKGKDRILGEAGDDSISGGDDNDNLNGGNGFDTILGGKGNDNIFGGNEPVDEFGFGGGDNLEGEAGNDRINAGDGFDFLSGGDGSDSLFGGNDDDFLNGDAGKDTLDGGNGFDFLDGGTGADRLIGGRDFDVLDGGAGNDTLIGVSTTSGFGRFEQDDLTGGQGRDSFVLGDANRVYYSDGDPNTRDNFDFARILDFNAAQDFIQLKGSASVYRLDIFTSGGVTNANLIFDTGANDKGEIIGRLENVSDTLSLSSPAFVFV